MPVTRAHDRLAPMIETGLGLLAPNEDVIYEVAPMATPNGVSLTVSLFVKGAVLGTVLTSTGLLDPFADEDKVHERLGDLLKIIFQARSEQLQMPGQPKEQAEQSLNGQGPH